MCVCNDNKAYNLIEQAPLLQHSLITHVHISSESILQTVILCVGKFVTEEKQSREVVRGDNGAALLEVPEHPPQQGEEFGAAGRLVSPRGAHHP